VFKEQTSSIDRDGRIGWGVHQTKSKRQMLKEEKVRFANAKRLLRKHKLKAELVDPGSDDEDDDYFATCVVVDAEGNVLDKTFDWRLESGLLDIEMLERFAREYGVSRDMIAKMSQAG
jgi:hypothetical protein